MFVRVCACVYVCGEDERSQEQRSNPGGPLAATLTHLTRFLGDRMVCMLCLVMQESENLEAGFHNTEPRMLVFSVLSQPCLSARCCVLCRQLWTLACEPCNEPWHPFQAPLYSLVPPDCTHGLGTNLTNIMQASKMCV